MSVKPCLNPIIAYMKFDNTIGKNKLSGFHNLRKQADFNNDSYDYLDFKTCVEMNKKIGYETVLLPCRKCVNCQLNRSLEWSIRNTLESREYDSNQCLFITLTYDDLHLVDKHLFKISNSIEPIKIASLKKTDLQIFIKKLRDVFKNFKIRYYACGEYGGRTFRPHYHILLYGLSLDDIKASHFKDLSWAFDVKYSTDTGTFYYSELLEREIWSKGFVDITEFSEFTAMYVSRYCTKKISDIKKLDGHIYYNDLQRQFNLMSLKPAISFNYFEKHKDEMYKNDELIYHFDDKTYILKPFAYYDKKYDFENPDNFKFIKENRSAFSDVCRYFESLETNISIGEYLRNEESNALNKYKERSKV